MGLVKCPSPAGQHRSAPVGGGYPFHPAQRRTDYRGANYRAAGPTTGFFFHGTCQWNIWKTNPSYPLVNCHITMERSTIFYGKTHYKWPCSIAMEQITRGYGKQFPVDVLNKQIMFNGKLWACL